jgi:hypothetical protein
LTAKEAIAAAQEQDEEFNVRRYPSVVWHKAFKAERVGGRWILDGKLGLDRNQIHLDAATGRLKCLIVID